MFADCGDWYCVILSTGNGNLHSCDWQLCSFALRCLPVLLLQAPAINIAVLLSVTMYVYLLLKS